MFLLRISPFIFQFPLTLHNVVHSYIKVTHCTRAVVVRCCWI